MAPKSKKGKTVDKWRKKKYFPVLAPKVFQERELGQSLAYDSNSLMGRCLTANLMALTGNMRKQDVSITFRVTKVQGDTAYTMVDKYVITPSAIKRKVRRQRDRVDESFTCVTKDNFIVRLKPLVITQNKTSGSVRCVLRKKLIQLMMNAVRQLDYEQLVMDVMQEKLQRDVAKVLNKVSPVKFVYMRMMIYVGRQEGSPGEPQENPEVKDQLGSSKSPVESHDDMSDEDEADVEEESELKQESVDPAKA